MPGLPPPSPGTLGHHVRQGRTAARAGLCSRSLPLLRELQTGERELRDTVPFVGDSGGRVVQSAETLPGDFPTRSHIQIQPEDPA